MDSVPVPKAPPRTLLQWLRDMPRWEKVSLLLATGALVGGALLMALGDGGADTAGPASATGQTGLTSGFLPTPGGGQTPGSGGAGTGAQGAEEPAARGVFRLGFSFIAGFCLGAFLRATMKVASIAIGFWLAMTLLLSYFGLVVVDWTAIDSLWSRFATNVESEWGNFQRFMTGSLPAAGLATAGLAIGLKRH
jgi:uncharacterized membrane protein (Fun14 family)